MTFLNKNIFLTKKLNSFIVVKSQCIQIEVTTQPVEIKKVKK